MKASIQRFIGHYNHHRHHENLRGLIPVEIRFRRSKPFNARVKEANEPDSDSDVCKTAGKPPENQAADEPDLRLIYAAIAS